MQLVLVFGKDPQLLSIRSAMLENSGYQVLSASNQNEAEKMLQETPVDLLITCHTVDLQLRDTLLDSLRTISPHTYALTLSAGYQANPHPLHANVDTSAGPAALMAAVRDLSFRQKLTEEKG